VNCFDNAPVYTTEEVRDALDLDAHIPVVLCDARDRSSCKTVLMTLVEHLIARATSSVA
jgi:signal recognition particle receptor subunit beta